MAEFTFHTSENSSGKRRELLEGIEKGYGFLPNLFAYMVEAPEAVEAYLKLNELVARTSLSGSQQQVALLAASVENACGFCSVAHRAMGKAKGANPQTLAALADDAPIDHPQDRALVDFTRTLIRTRGNPSEEQLQAFLAAGFSKQQIFEVILIVAIKTLSNYSNHLTHPEPNKELLAML